MDLNQTIIDNFIGVVTRHAKKSALAFKKGGVYFSYTYEELLHQVRLAATGLEKCGLAAGDKLAILSANRPEWAIVDLAAMYAGAVTVPVHTTLSPRIISYVINHCGSKMLIVAGRDLLDKVLLCQAELVDLETIIYIGSVDDELKKISSTEIISWQEVLDFGKVRPAAMHKGGSDDIISIIYTSGTTGLPKGVCLTSRNFQADIEAMVKAVNVDSHDLFLLFCRSPMSWSAPSAIICRCCAERRSPMLKASRLCRKTCAKRSRRY